MRLFSFATFTHHREASRLHPLRCHGHLTRPVHAGPILRHPWANGMSSSGALTAGLPQSYSTTTSSPCPLSTTSYPQTPAMRAKVSSLGMVPRPMVVATKVDTRPISRETSAPVFPEWVTTCATASSALMSVSDQSIPRPYSNTNPVTLRPTFFEASTKMS